MAQVISAQIVQYLVRVNVSFAENSQRRFIRVLMVMLVMEQTWHLPKNVNIMNVQQTSTYSNKMVCIPHRSQTPLQLPQSCLTRPAPLIHLPPSAPAPSKPQNYLAPVVHQQKGMLPTIHDIQTKPTISDNQTKPTSMTSELFSIHRFLISNKGMIGINVSTLYPNRRCIVMSSRTQLLSTSVWR